MGKKQFIPETAMCILHNDGFGCHEYKERPKECKWCLKAEMADCKRELKNLKKYLKEIKR